MHKSENGEPKPKKWVQIAILVVAITIFLLTLLSFSDVCRNAADIAQPLMGILLLLQAYNMWHQYHKIAVFSAWGGGFALLVSLIGLLIKYL